MGRMHTPGKGMSSSALPYKRSPPSWLKITPTEVRRRSYPLPLRSRPHRSRAHRTRSRIGKEIRATPVPTRLSMQSAIVW
jgi:hypothetical protein